MSKIIYGNSTMLIIIFAVRNIIVHTTMDLAFTHID